MGVRISGLTAPKDEVNERLDVPVGFKDLFIPYCGYLYYIFFQSILFTEYILPFLIALLPIFYTIYPIIFN